MDDVPIDVPVDMVCARCGATAPQEQASTTWSCAVERGRRQWACQGCTRENARSIEARLDEAWW